MKLQLKHPVEPLVIIQPFGVNGAYYQENGIGIQGHNGLDLQAHHGQHIYAAHDGQANYEIDDKGGHGVVVITNGSFDYKGGRSAFKTIYWHMVDSLKELQYKSPIEGNSWIQVKAGDLLGYADSTGLSTGDHLHFGLKAVYPNEPPQAVGTTNPDNGYLGAIDPSDFLPEAQPHVFTSDIAMGDDGYECVKLQDRLLELGYFNHTTYPHYGELTRQAVLAFQIDHCNLSFWERIVLRGKSVGPKTRMALNAV